MTNTSEPIRSKLISWYNANHRDLPWRKTKSAYEIWVSEVILQQTRVNQGLPYYFSFLENFPSVISLAESAEDHVLKVWQGLGYYSRARNMRQTAQEVLSKHNGIFPAKYDELIELKGIGPYTAAAVASFASNEAVAAIDGNGLRVFSRLYGIEENVDLPKTRRLVCNLANNHLGDRADLFNQALMELGALICTPRNVKCELCPLLEHCLAFKNNKVDSLPVKTPKKKSSQRHLNYLVISFEETLYMKKRGSNDVWQGLYDFPLLESNQPLSEPEQIYSALPSLKQLQFKQISQSLNHKLSHQDLHIKFWEFQTDSPISQAEWISTPLDQISKTPVPQPIAKYLKKRQLPQ